MQTEFETKILEINIDAMQAKLADLWATKVAEKFQRRFIYEFTPQRPWSRVRLRTDGNKSTLTIKERENFEIDGTKELEIVVDDFDATNLILQKLWYIPDLYQENKRISYVLDGTEIEIDSRPMIPPYLEVEWKSKEEVEKMVQRLGFDLAESTSMSTTAVYAKYGLEITDYKELRFK